MNPRVTLKDIARELNISIGTIDRALHDRKEIKPETKDLILKKVSETGYKPNVIARSLRLPNQKEIAVVIPDDSEFWGRVREGIDYALKEISPYNVNVSFKACGEITDIEADGVIIVPSGHASEIETINKLFDEGKWVVLLNDDILNSKRNLYIGPDNALIGMLAAELTGKFTGGQGICITLTGKDGHSEALSAECRERLWGFHNVLKNEFPQMECIDTEYDFGEDASLPRELFDQGHIIRCIYSTDGYISQAARALIELGVEGIVLVGHEISDEVNRYLQDGTVAAAICQNPFLQGYFALKYMIDYLMEGKIPPQDKIYINYNIFTKYSFYNRRDFAQNASLFVK
jgi:DNA-binding LacI/PurR family transcriptional regulator